MQQKNKKDVGNMKKPIILFVLLINLFFTTAWASNTFVVRRIEIVGLQRISPETVYSYLPVRQGQTLHADNTAAIIKALYKTGFFEHVA
jgi:outer membrane protein insertion porin family